MHEEYQEICAVASIGQASPEEIARLGEHLLRCSACQRAYSEFTNMAALQHVHDSGKQGISPEEERQLPDPDLLRRRFLQRATEKGLLSSGQPGIMGARAQLRSSSTVWQRLGWNPSVAALVALALILACMLSGYELGRRLAATPSSTDAVHNSSDRSRDTVGIAAGVNPDFKALNANFEAQVAKLKGDIKKNQQQLRDLQESLSLASGDKQKLTAERAKLEESTEVLQKKLAEAEGLLQANRGEQAKLQEEATKLRSEAAAAQATYIADQIRIRELGDELGEKTAAAERNGQLLQRDRDIRDLMTARNLHIFDVFDTDPKGKTSPAFGRIFYTEGTSLVFYAYDLNEAKVQNANYHYRVWGSQEAQKDKATSLGIFYSDDKSQRRWVFKCDDPKILGQIDSVFVTLEPSGATSSHPKGQKLLDAYLRGIPNHP
jgi:hypothetical protein